jgi:GntR family phosphonate transport system transcriptional regulator
LRDKQILIRSDALSDSDPVTGRRHPRHSEKSAPVQDGADSQFNRVNGVALWKQIQDELEYEILSGIYSPGQRLPTESELGERFSVNRHTVRQALAALQSNGLTISKKGQGVFVRADAIDYAIGDRVRWSENVRSQGYEPTGRYLRSSVRPASGPVAEALRLVEGDPVLLIEALREADRRPITLTYHHFPDRRFPGLDMRYRQTQSVTEALRSYGVTDIVRKSTWVSARMPRAFEANVLQQPVGRPVLVTTNVNVDQDGGVIEYGISLFAGDKVRLLVQGEQ